MQLPVLAIRNHQLTWLVSAILILLGLVSFFTMPRAEDPQLDFPMSNIIVVNPGTTPSDMESLIVDPIEDILNELEDVQEIKSNIEDGLAKIHIEFLYGSDADEKYDDVQAAINSIRDQLPSGIVKLETYKISPNEVGIIQLAMSSESGDFTQLRQVSEILERRIEQVGGVKRVDIDAQAEMEVQILLQPAKLHALGLSLEQVQQAINSASLNIPGGHVHAGDRRFSVLTSGDFGSLEEIKSTVISSSNGKPIYLRNIASVVKKEGLPSYRAFYQDKPTLILSVVQRKGSNIFSVTEQVNLVIEAYKAELPRQINLYTIIDQSISVDKRVSGFFSNLVQGLILVAIATLLVLGRGPSFVVVTAIPISIFIAIGWLDLSGFALQQMSIVGLVIALGLLVDNAIVVTENVLRYQRQGMDSKLAAEKGSQQVAMAILSGTLTTVLSFVPMLIMQNGSGQFIRSMPVTVVLTLLASLLVALTLTPLLSSLIKKKNVSETKMQKRLDRLADKQYSQSLEWALSRPKRVLAMAFSVFFVAFMLFPFIGVSLFPKAEKPLVLINLDLPEGASFYQSQAAALTVEKVLRKEEFVEDVVVNVGRGNPRVYYNVSPDRQTPNFAQLLVKLKEGKLDVVEPFIADLRGKLNNYPGVKVSIKEFNQGPPSEAPVAIRVMGENWLDIRKGANLVEDVMRQTPGTVNIENAIGKHKIDLKLDINRDKAAMLALPLNQIDKNIRAALVGLPMGNYKDDRGDDYTILLKSSDTNQPELTAFDTLMLRSQTGAMVPLKQVASVKLETSMPSFQHYNMQRTATITSDVKPEFNTAAVTEVVLSKIDKLTLPLGVSISIGGEEENREESFGGMAKALIIAMLGIFAVLVMQFKSFKQPLIVFSAIPFAATGAFFALFITGYTFSFTAFVGLTSLVGIVVNNAIILIDYANQKLTEGEDKVSAIMEAAKTRMTPILLTSVTTIGGLLPLTLSGSSMWSPMGTAIIGGLLVSTLLTLFVVPVLYVYLSDEIDSDTVNAHGTESDSQLPSEPS
ncbi:MAG: multidrug efflux pump subunit AcrB [Psychrobacter glaciei]|jgi:multidrug efflux pump subunit AcrB